MPPKPDGSGGGASAASQLIKIAGELDRGGSTAASRGAGASSGISRSGSVKPPPPSTSRQSSDDESSEGEDVDKKGGAAATVISRAAAPAAASPTAAAMPASASAAAPQATVTAAATSAFQQPAAAARASAADAASIGGSSDDDGDGRPTRGAGPPPRSLAAAVGATRPSSFRSPNPTAYQLPSDAPKRPAAGPGDSYNFEQEGSYEDDDDGGEFDEFSGEIAARTGARGRPGAPQQRQVGPRGGFAPSPKIGGRQAGGRPMPPPTGRSSEDPMRRSGGRSRGGRSGGVGDSYDSYYDSQAGDAAEEGQYEYEYSAEDWDGRQVYGGDGRQRPRYPRRPRVVGDQEAPSPSHSGSFYDEEGEYHEGRGGGGGGRRQERRAGETIRERLEMAVEEALGRHPSLWDVRDVCNWVEVIGFVQYRRKFSHNW